MRLRVAEVMAYRNNRDVVTAWRFWHSSPYVTIEFSSCILSWQDFWSLEYVGFLPKLRLKERSVVSITVRGRSQKAS